MHIKTKHQEQGFLICNNHDLLNISDKFLVQSLIIQGMKLTKLRLNMFIHVTNLL